MRSGAAGDHRGCWCRAGRRPRTGRLSFSWRKTCLGQGTDAPMLLWSAELPRLCRETRRGKKIGRTLCAQKIFTSFDTRGESTTSDVHLTSGAGTRGVQGGRRLAILWVCGWAIEWGGVQARCSSLCDRRLRVFVPSLSSWDCRQWGKTVVQCVVRESQSTTTD